MPLELVKAKKATVNVDTSGDLPEVWVAGFIYDGLGAYLNQLLMDLQRYYGGVRLYVDSGGGYVADALSTYDFVRQKGINLYVEGYGQVSSAATLYLCAAGPKNCALAPNCDSLIHAPFNIYSGKIVEEEVDRIAGIYSEATGMSTKEAKKLMAAGDDGKKLTAKEMKELGFVAQVLKPAKAAATAKPSSEVEEIEVYQLQQMAAAAEVAPEPTMSTEATTKVKRTFNIQLTPAQALAAMGKRGLLYEGEIDPVAEVKEAEDAAAHLAEEVGTIKTENEGLKTTVSTVTTERDTLKTTVDEVSGKLTAAEATIETQANEIATLKAKVAEMGAAPVAAATTGAGAKGTQTVAAVPGTGKPENPNAAALRYAMKGATRASAPKPETKPEPVTA